MSLKEYAKARIPELTSRLGAFLTIIPLVIDLTTKQTLVLLFVSVVLLGVPEDKLKIRK